MERKPGREGRCEEWEDRWDGYGEGGCRLRGADGYTDGRLTSPMCSSYEEMEMGGEKASCSTGESRRAPVV